jgi:hypothetical protein
VCPTVVLVVYAWQKVGMRFVLERVNWRSRRVGGSLVRFCFGAIRVFREGPKRITSMCNPVPADRELAIFASDPRGVYLTLDTLALF